jgi:hypothetical protein
LVESTRSRRTILRPINKVCEPFVPIFVNFVRFIANLQFEPMPHE